MTNLILEMSYNTSFTMFNGECLFNTLLNGHESELSNMHQNVYEIFHFDEPATIWFHTKRLQFVN